MRQTEFSGGICTYGRLYRLTNSHQIWRANSRAEGCMMLGSATPTDPRGGALALAPPNFGYLLLPTPCNLERPILAWQPIYGRVMFLQGTSHVPQFKGMGPQCSQIFGTLNTPRWYNTEQANIARRPVKLRSNGSQVSPRSLTLGPVRRQSHNITVNAQTGTNADAPSVYPMHPNTTV